jgi:branched-chain amino acid transport system substrate-binding protein
MRRALALLVTFGLTSGACGAATAPSAEAPSGKPSEAPSVKPSEAPSVKLTSGKIVIGVINDQSVTAYADLSGKNSVEAVKMAVEDFKKKYGDNALGGPIEVIAGDHKNDPAVAKSLAQEFYQRNNVDVILDVPSSASGLAVSDVAKDQKKVYINVTSTFKAFTGASCNKYTFHYAYNTYMLAAGTAASITQAGGKQWYITYPKYPFGTEFEAFFRQQVVANGGTVIQSDSSPFPNQTGDFSALIAKAAQLKPQVLGVMQSSPELVNVVKQYNELKLKDQNIKLAVGLLFDTDITALGQDAFAGVQFTTPWIWSMDAQSRAFADRFLERTKIRPTFAHAGNYSAAMQYLEAVRRAGTDDADAVVTALEGYKFSDFFIRNGQIRPEDHWVMHDALFAEVKSKAESKEPFDYSKVISTIPADKASRPVADALAEGCKMPK